MPVAVAMAVIMPTSGLRLPGPRPASATIAPQLTRPARHPKIALMVATFSQPWFTLDVVLTFDFPHAA
jgi:hypothetical protein